MTNFDNFKVDSVEDNGYYFDTYDSDQENGVIHDDGFMHVRYNGKNYAFDIGQEVPTGKYNKTCNQILNDIGVSHPRITGSNN